MGTIKKIMINRLQLYLYISVFLLLFSIPIFLELPDNTVFMRELQNTGHTFLFGFLSIITLRLTQVLLNAKNTDIKPYILSFILSFISGIFIEIIQVTIDRDADISDVLRNFLGIISFLGFYYLFNKIRLKVFTLWDILISIMSVGLFLGSLISMGSLSMAYLNRDNSVPVILDFNSNWSKYFIYSTNAYIEKIAPGQHKHLQIYHAEILFKKGGYSKIEIHETSPDWSDYASLCFSIYSDSAKEYNLNIRIHDTKHNYEYTDRFNRLLLIRPHHNHICISLEEVINAPLGRLLDISDIESVIIFSHEKNVDRKFMMSNFILK